MMNLQTIGNLPDLGQYFKPQEELADQSAQDTTDTAQQVGIAAGDPNKQAAAMAKLNGMQPDAPQLQFGIAPNSDAAASISQGLSGGVNNYFAMKNYKQKQELAKQVGDLYAASIKQQQAAAQQAADQDAAYEASLPEAQRTMYHNMLPKAKEEYQKHYGNGAVDIYQDPLKNSAVAKGALSDKTNYINNIRQSILDQSGWDIFNPKRDQQTPAGVLNALAGLGIKDSDIHDAVTEGVKRDEAVKTAHEANRQPVVDAQALEDLQGKRLTNIAQQIKNFYDPERMRTEIEGMGLSNADKATKLNELANAEKVYQSFQDKMARGEQITPDDIVQVSTTLNFLSGHDPKIADVIRKVAGIKEGKPIDQKQLQAYLNTSPPNPSPVGGSSSYSVSGNVQLPPVGATVTSPKTGQIYTHMGDGKFKDAKGNVFDATSQAQPATKPPADLAKNPTQQGLQVPSVYHGQPVTIQNGNAVIGKGTMINGQMHYNANQYIDLGDFRHQVADEERYNTLKSKAMNAPNSFTQAERNEFFDLARRYDPKAIKAR